MTAKYLRHKNEGLIIERIKTQLSAAFLTQSSIIQAVVFAVFIYHVFPKVSDFSDFTQLSNNMVMLIGYIISFILMTVVWGEYIVAVLTFRWIPHIDDALIPFLTGLAQVSVIYFIDNKISSCWLFSLAFLCFLGFCSYWRMYHRADKNRDENQPILSAMHTLRRINYITSGGLCITLVILGFILPVIQTYCIDLILSFVFLFVTIFLVLKMYSCWQTVKHRLNC